MIVAATAIRGSFTEDGTGPIWLDNVGCNSRHIRLIDCPNLGLGVHNCGHSDDAGVSCTGKVPI